MGVGGEPVEGGVLGEVQGGDDEDGVAVRGLVGGHAFPLAARVVQLAGVDDADLPSGVEGAAVEGVQDAVVGGRVRCAVGGREGRVLLHQPLAGGGVDDRDVGIGFEPRDERPYGLELLPQPGQFGVRAARSAAVRQNAAPVGLRAEAQGLPLPVLDHAGPAADEGPGGLAPLAVVGGAVVPRVADGGGVGLGDQERFLPGGEHPVGGLVQRPDAGALPLLLVVVRCRVGQEQAVLHGVVGVAGGDVEAVGELVVLHGGAGVGDAGGDELPGAGVLADEVGLPADELGALAGLELPPGDVVLGLHVAVGRPQVGPGGQAVGPVDQAPFAVEGLDVAVLGAQVVGEALEDAVVVEELQARFVVDLEADDGRVAAYRATILRMIRSAWKRKAGWVKSTSWRAPQPMRSPVRRSPVISGYWRASHGGTAYVGVPRMTEMPRSWAPSSTGWSQSSAKRPFSGSQVDQTDSPTRMTVKCASAIRSRSVLSCSSGRTSGP